MSKVFRCILSLAFFGATLGLFPSSAYPQDNRTRDITVGGRGQGSIVEEQINVNEYDRIVFRANRSVDGGFAGKPGKLYVLLNFEGEASLAPYVFARPRDEYFSLNSGNGSVLRVFARVYEGLFSDSPVLALSPDFPDIYYEADNFTTIENDIEFVIGELKGLEGKNLSLQTAAYYEDANVFQPIQRVDLKMVSGPVCGDAACDPSEREGDEFCFVDCCGDGYCAQQESKGAEYCRADCCGDGLCTGEESDICPQDCFISMTCPSCPYEFNISSEYDYVCNGKCPGYINGELFWSFENLNIINTGSFPVDVEDPNPLDGNYRYIKSGSNPGSIGWISPPGELKWFKFILPEGIRLSPSGEGDRKSFELDHWSVRLSTVVRVGPGAHDVLIQWAGEQCQEGPPTVDDYLRIRDEVWSGGVGGGSSCNPEGSCIGFLDDEKIWYELGFHLPNPDPPVGCTDEPGNACDLGQSGQSVLIEASKNALPGCYYALVVNWGNEVDSDVRLLFGAGWTREQ